MLLRKKQLRFWLIHVPVLVLYLLFFGVQLFFNLDINPDSTGGDGCFVTANVATHLPYVLVRSDNDNPHARSEIRLNKRFQPPSVDYTPSQEAPRPDWHLLLQTRFTDISSRYVVGFDHVCTLRGPPSLS